MPSWRSRSWLTKRLWRKRWSRRRNWRAISKRRRPRWGKGKRTLECKIFCKHSFLIIHRREMIYFCLLSVTCPRSLGKIQSLSENPRKFSLKRILSMMAPMFQRGAALVVLQWPPAINLKRTTSWMSSMGCSQRRTKTLTFKWNCK